LRQCLRDPRLIAGLAPDDRVDHLLVEQAPDEDVAEPRVGIFLQPAGSSQAQITELSVRTRSPWMSTGIRLSGDRRANSSSPKKGVIGSIS